MTKRKNKTPQDADQDHRSKKRPRNRDNPHENFSLASQQPSKSTISSYSSSSSSSNKPRQDPTYGQRGAFPGLCLDGSGTSGLRPAVSGSGSGSSEQDELGVAAMAYLRNVRSEAIAIPHVLAAASGDGRAEAASKGEEGEEIDDIEKNGKVLNEEDNQGYYSDGAYVALPATNNKGSDADYLLENNEKGEMIEGVGRETASGVKVAATLAPQTAYHDRLKALFLAQRRALQSTPSASAVRALSPTQLISLPPNHRGARSEWLRLMRIQHPSPVQLAVMDTETILQLLRLVTTMLRRRNMDERLSAWVWGLLGRLDDVGTLSSEEVCVVRDLGKKVIWVMRGFEGMNEMKESGDDVEVANAIDGDNEDECEQGEENGNIDAGEDRSEGEIEDCAEISKEESKIIETPRKHLQDSESPQGCSEELSSSKNVAATEDYYSELSHSIEKDKKESHLDQNFNPESEHLSSMPNTDDPYQPLPQTGVNGVTLSSEHESPLRPSFHHRRNTSSPLSSPSNDLEIAKARLLQNININHDTHNIRDHHNSLLPKRSSALALAPASDADAMANADIDAIMSVDPNNQFSPINTEVQTHQSHYQEDERQLQKGQGNDTALATDPSPVPTTPTPAQAPASESAPVAIAVKAPNINTRATLAMILTVAGEFYGQRDLLEERERWA